MRISSLRSAIERVACLVALPILGIGIYSTVRLAAADAAYRANTVESLQKAVRLEGGDADYHALLAEHLEGMGQDAEPDRQTAARLSPLESKNWIGLAVRAETAGDTAAAEKLYLHAAEVDHMFTPSWSLMNFYFRQQDAPKFWRWAKRTFEMAYGDQTAAFRLCWLMTDDGRVIERVLPGNLEIRREYLDFLINTGRYQNVSPLDHEVAEATDISDAPWLVNYCERIVAARPRSAVDVWNVLCRKGFEPFQPIDLEKGDVVTNGKFLINPVEHGFDWRIPVVSGAQVAPRRDAGGMSVQLNGDQPEDCVILMQIVPVSPGRTYRMTYEYSSGAASPASGLSWELLDAATNQPIVNSGPLKITGDAVSEEMSFTAGATGATKLALHYRREPGTVRHEEELTLRRIGIRAES